jgi:myb proto-oncogene protein
VPVKVVLYLIRWYNHLNPEINNSFWSPQDEKKLFDAHKIHGNKWKSISRLFVGR